MTARRVLSLWQPWATLCVGFNGAGTVPPMPAKSVETRHFKPVQPLPIDVAIHATKKWGPEFSATIKKWPFNQCLIAADYSLRDPSKDYHWAGDREYNGELESRDGRGLKRIPLGAIIGVATIVEVRSTESWLTKWSQFEDGSAERYAEEVAVGDYAPGRYGWRLANARELTTPIPFKGRQDVLYLLDKETDDQIDEQLAGVHA